MRICSRRRRIYEESEEMTRSPSYSESSKIKEKCSNNSSDSDNTNNINNNNYMNQNTEELIKCFICLNQSINPVICRFCGNMACKICFNKWIRNNSKCGCCRKKISKEDLISPPIIKNINNYINNFQEEKSHEICKVHNEKILFFCMKCLKKYCGKCLFFGSEEAKKHQGHNIIDYSDLKKSEYNDLINKLESIDNYSFTIEDVISENEIFKEEIKTIFDNAKMALKQFQKVMENKLQNKINIISKYSIELIDAMEDSDKCYKDIVLNLNKLENIDKKIENFDANKSKDELVAIWDKINYIKNNLAGIRNKEMKIDFRLNYFNIIKTYNEINDSEGNYIAADNNPVLSCIKMKLVDKDKKTFLKIIIPRKSEKEFYVFLLLKFNNKIYHFELKEKEEKEDDKDFGDNNENIKINISDDKFKQEEDNKVYISYIPKNELNKGNNIFYFSNYVFSVD